MGLPPDDLAKAMATARLDQYYATTQQVLRSAMAIARQIYKECGSEEKTWASMCIIIRERVLNDLGDEGEATSRVILMLAASIIETLKAEGTIRT